MNRKGLLFLLCRHRVAGDFDVEGAQMERLSKFRRSASTPLSRPTFTMRPTAACWATRCGCCPAPTDSLEPIPSVDAEKRGDRKGEPDERQYDHCNSNDKRPEQIFARSLRRRVDRVELPVLLIESFDNVIHRITSCTPAGRRIHPVSTDVSPPRKNMTAFVWARAPVLFLPVGSQPCGEHAKRNAPSWSLSPIGSAATCISSAG